MCFLKRIQLLAILTDNKKVGSKFTYFWDFSYFLCVEIFCSDHFNQFGWLRGEFFLLWADWYNIDCPWSYRLLALASVRSGLVYTQGHPAQTDNSFEPSFHFGQKYTQIVEKFQRHWLKSKIRWRFYVRACTTCRGFIVVACSSARNPMRFERFSVRKSKKRYYRLNFVPRTYKTIPQND